MNKLAVTLLLVMPMSLNAGVYKWVDASGGIHYSERPPVNVATQTVAVNNPREQSVGNRDDNFDSSPLSQVIRQLNSNQQQLNCSVAVRHANAGINYLVRMADINYRDGFTELSKYQTESRYLSNLKRSFTIRNCVTASGKHLAFYACAADSAKHFAFCISQLSDI
ncbi:DUF4124 domain-containing protein [Ferrimonas lipolytica]|uniref:DUF4124 domain-containing protein n=1 Tax=Ferrimonas lipolytica TaxID=2724191 RepID=A0A6H1UE25_9GAMM|nr:DUF4124 domain-containing protein [Ferrimonas lipolytica]QIZ77078.1 DUF4124 domain-containing protein [Ferrimonas lipolytica]